MYCAMKLNLKRKAKKRIITRERQPFEDNQQFNKIWALDLMRDSMYDGRPVGHSMSSTRATEKHSELSVEHRFHPEDL